MANLNAVPEGWTEEKLDNITKVVDSAHQTPTFSSTGYPMVRVGDIKGGKISLANTVFVDDEVFAVFTRKYKPQFNDILMTRVGSYGRSSIVKTDKTFCLGQNTVVINPQLIVADYLYQFLQAENIDAQIEDTVGGSSQKSLSLAAIKALQIFSPPLPEQQKIAAILTSVDEVIEKTQAQIDKLKDLKTAMMQTLLTNGVGTKHRTGDGERYTPHTEFKDSPVGRIPKSWEVVELSQLVKSDSPICYGILMPGQHVDGGVPVIKVKNIKDNKIEQAGLLLTSKDIDDKYKRSRVNIDDILLTIRGTTGRLAMVPVGLSGANITQDTARIRIDDNELSDYVYTYLQGPDAQKQIADQTIGQAVKGINLSEVRKLNIAIPKKEDMRAITASISSLDKRYNLLAQKLLKLQNTKKALMQDLLTGKVRVKVD